MNGKIYKYFNKKKYEETGIESYYIGQTVQSIKQRAGKDGCHYTDNYDTKFANAIRKWGWDAFECEILEEGIQTHEELNELEIKYISEYDSYNNGYNTTTGGTEKAEVSKETRKKISDATDKRRVYSPELNMVFDSVKEASRFINCKSACNISAVCNGKRSYAGKATINNVLTELTWKYIDSDEEYNKIINSSNNLTIEINKPITQRKVYCPELDMAFDSVIDAGTYIGYTRKGSAHITEACKGRRHSAGTFEINGKKTKLTWKYID